MKILLLTLVTLLSQVSLANPPGSAGYQVIPHENCNEINLIDSATALWHTKGSGGVFKVSHDYFKSLSQNQLNIHFGSGERALVTLQLLGKNVVPDSVASDRTFAVESQSLYDSSRGNSVIGKFAGFTDLESETRYIKDSTGQFGRRDRLLFAALYMNTSSDPQPSVVPCTYVSGDINPMSPDSQCLWIDSSSRGSNGKPYCW